jgi:hypothetical protein
MLQRFILFGLIVIAQPCWAIAILKDTIIIGNEVLYIEEVPKSGADSIIHSKQADFKKNHSALPWAYELNGTLSSNTMSWINSADEDLISAQKFLRMKNQSIGYGARFAVYTQLHQHIHVGLGLDFQKYNSKAVSLNVQESDHSIGFFQDDNSTVYQIIQTEIQPGVLQSDTLSLQTRFANFKVETWMIPMHFRFYVNSYSKNQNWRAFGQISPCVLFQKMTFSDQTEQMLLNENGRHLKIGLQTQQNFNGNVLIKLGIERKLSNQLQCHAGITFQFPPVATSMNDDNEFVVGSRFIEFGLRWSRGKWKN